MVKLMEVCGTHTMAIARAGIKSLLPKEIRLLSGPGCPVCVTPAGIIDRILGLSECERVVIATYGDMIRVPGSRPGDTLGKRSALGAEVRVVYSPADAVYLAEEHPDREVVFLGIGFETTAPATGAAVLLAKERNVRNFSVLTLLKRVGPALRALIADPDFDVQGFLCPGHVASVIGEKGFRFLAEEYGLPSVISGFEPEDMILAIRDLMRQIRSGAARLENRYRRAVSPEGNRRALQLIDECFQPCGALWRGLGYLENSGCALKGTLAEYDASRRFGIVFPDAEEPSACLCGDVIRGKRAPGECPLFGSVCTQEDPVGPCMVSSEGTCAAAYQYGDV